MLTDDKRRALVAGLPVGRLLTKTNGPFTKSGDRPSTPSDVADVVLDLAALNEVAPIEMARTIRLNLRTVLGGRAADSQGATPSFSRLS